MSEQKVSPLPWTNACSIFVEDANQRTICIPYGYSKSADKAEFNAQTEANAAFIVRCVNAHAQLVEALEKAGELIEAEYCSHSGPCGAATKGCKSSFIHAALAAAKGER